MIYRKFCRWESTDTCVIVIIDLFFAFSPIFSILRLMNKYILYILILILSIGISFVTRLWYMEFTSNISYIKIKGVYQYPIFEELNSKGIQIGTPIIGTSWLPFGVYGCNIGFGGSMIVSRCNRSTWWWEFANLFNIIFWFLLLSAPVYYFPSLNKK